MSDGATFSFTAPLWEPNVEPAWVFVTVPAEQSDEISDLVPSRPGFGSVRVTATIGGSRWKTSIFPSKQAAAYVLPVKRAIREREQLDVGQQADVSIQVDLDSA